MTSNPLDGSPYVSYSYSYPHKTAYRPLPSTLALGDAWASENREAIFLYLHIPFCEMRCGFCNLFTIANPQSTLESDYLTSVRLEAESVRAAIGEVKVARMAIGGGTPTYLEAGDLDSLFRLASDTFEVDTARTPISVETSPGTATPEKLAILVENGVDRISIGVQSFIEEETAAIGRGQERLVVETALANIRNAGVDTLNIDLMYGLPHQTLESWIASLNAALAYRPEELYLYPLYVRPLTGLGKTQRQWDDMRLEYYRAGRDLLRSAGYTQVSMRMFQLPRNDQHENRPVYCCQDDGMIGLGCGARSYTRSLHYSTEFAVGRTGVKAILSDYLRKSSDDFASIVYGIRLDPCEQARRYVINSILQAEGLEIEAYRRRFGDDPLDELPQLAELGDWGLATMTAGRIALTDAGLERSDAIGPWLYSESMRSLMSEFDLR